MQIEIKGKKIELRYGFRALIIYEELMGETFKPGTLMSMVALFYSTAVASCKEMTLDFDQFVDWLDSDPNKMRDFSEWLNEQVGRENQLAPDDSADDQPKDGGEVKKN